MNQTLTLSVKATAIGISSPCVNGICRQRHPTSQRGASNEKSKFWCDCVAGFEGDRCEIQIDHCKGNPCPKDAVMCINSITEPQCICKVVSNIILRGPVRRGPGDRSD